jgi:primosomal protein N' (replication factor Y)
MDQQVKEKEVDVDVLGPIPAPLVKLRGKYRWQIILKSDNLIDMRRVNQCSIEILSNSTNLGSVIINVDVDPIGML